MNHHLVILKKPYLDLILSGRKTIESRLTEAETARGGVRSPAAAPSEENWKDDVNGER